MDFGKHKGGEAVGLHNILSYTSIEAGVMVQEEASEPLEVQTEV